MMVPVTQEHAGLAVVFATSFDDPVHEVCAILVVQQAVALEPKVYVSENDGSLEEIHDSRLPSALVLVGK